MSSHSLLTASCLSQRLVSAVEEVMELVRATVIQYEQESAQVLRENQLLRSKLGQITGGLPPETAAESSPTGDEWADWTRHLDLDQNSGPAAAEQQNQQDQQACGDPDPDLDPEPAYEEQNPTQVPPFRNHGLNLSPEPGLVPFGPPTEPLMDPLTEPPTSCIGVKTEWIDHAPGHAPDPSDQSEQSGSSDVKTENLLPVRTIKTEPQDVELEPFSELQLVTMDTAHAQSAQQAPEEELVTMETLAFVERHRESDASAVATPLAPPLTTNPSHRCMPQPITAQLSTSQPITAQLQTIGHAHPSSQPRPRPPAGIIHNPPLLTGQTRDSALLHQRLHGNPEATPTTVMGRGQGQGHARGQAQGQGHARGQGQGQGRGRGRCAVSFPCPQCGKLFVHRSRLRVHMLIHTGEKPYACQRCGKRFNNDGTLKNHQRVHTQLRLYSCPLCSMRFKDAYTCRKHLHTHTRHRSSTHTHTHRTAGAQGQGDTLNTHHNTQRTQPQGSTLNTHHSTHTSLGAQAQSSHSAQNRPTHNTHHPQNTHTRHHAPQNTHTSRDHSLSVPQVRAHTHGGAQHAHSHTHSHSHTPGSALWRGRGTEAGGRGQR